MSVAEREKKIIKLNDERRRIIKFLKERTEDRYKKRLQKRLEEINKEIEELVYG